MNNEVQVYTITDEYMQSNYVKTLTYEWIENLIYFLCAYPIVALINHIIDKNEIMMYLNLLTIIPIFIMTYLRVKIKKMRNFILGIIGVVLLSSIIIGLFFKQYAFLFLVIVWAFDCIKKNTSKQIVQFNKFKLIIIEALLIPQIIIAAIADLRDFQALTAIISIVIMLISIGYICKARNIRLTMDDVKNKSFNNRDNNIFMAGIILLIAVFIFLLYKFGVFDIAYNLTRNLIHSLNDIFNSIINNIPTDSEVNLIPQDSDEVNNYYTETQGKFYQMLSIFLIVVLNITLIIAIIVISYLLINRILIYIKNLRNKDKVTFVFSSNEENEIKKKVNKIRHNISKSIFLNDKEKIRKLYKDKILKYKKNNIKVNNFFSTNEIQKEILSKVSDNIEDITMVYEKARYSNENITKDDVEILKNKKR